MLMLTFIFLVIVLIAFGIMLFSCFKVASDADDADDALGQNMVDLYQKEERHG